MRGTFMGKGAHIRYFYNEPNNHQSLQEWFTFVSGCFPQPVFDDGFPYPNWDTGLEP